MVYGYLFWVVALAVVLLREQAQAGHESALTAPKA